MKNNAIEVIRLLENTSNFEKNEILVGVLDLSLEELNRNMVMFAKEVLEDEEMAGALALEIVENGYIEIDAFRNGYIVMDDDELFDYLLEQVGI